VSAAPTRSTTSGPSNKSGPAAKPASAPSPAAPRRVG
jgi:hypothetical protein